MVMKSNTKLPVILHLRSAPGYGGGPDKTIIKSAVEIDHSRYAIHCAYIYDKRSREYPLYEKARFCKINAHRIIIKSAFSPSLLFNIRKLAKRLNVNIVHTHGYKSDIAGILACTGLKVKKITTVHGFIDTDSKLKIYNRMNIFALKFFDRVITVNHPQKEYLLRRGIKEKKITVIHNAVDPEEFSREKIDSNIRHELGISPEEHVLLYLGRLSEEKGTHNLIPVLWKVVQTHPQSVLLIAGEGPQKNKLESMVREKSLETKIRFPGYRKDSVNLLGASDVLLLPSRTEGIPNSVLEAMSMQVPVVATRVGGTPEIMNDGVEGFLVPPENPDLLADAVIKILDDPRMQTKMGMKGRERVFRDLSFSMRMRKMESLYDELLK